MVSSGRRHTPTDLRLYVNSTLEAEKRIGAHRSGYSTIMQIGANDPDGYGDKCTQFMYGLIDELTRYRRALAAEEISRLYRGGRMNADGAVN